ncbi:TonB C-terminal domain-containing protein, partial [bacterium]|nr:TonB C-terminal domain-containing protein [bacterium]
GISSISDETLGFNFPEYNKNMQTKIYNNLNINNEFPAKNKKLNSIIEFKVLRDGTIEKINVRASSGNQEFDNYCIDAINKSSPLPPLPEEYERNYVFIQYNFKKI